MSAALHLAGPDDLARLEQMVAAYHIEAGLASDAAHRAAALTPLLEGSPYGAVYLMGPRRSPVGYLIVTFGWSVEFGGMESFLDEFFVRDAVRGRGIATEALTPPLPELEAAGVRAVHLEVAADNARAAKLYGKLGFRLRDDYHLMTRLAKSPHRS